MKKKKKKKKKKELQTRRRKLETPRADASLRSRKLMRTLTEKSANKSLRGVKSSPRREIRETVRRNLPLSNRQRNNYPMTQH
ncbi:hypothetical protein PUN28_012662 [Cardiocondyla obscurior]|uniref:Uncharacterized protein n=1 Tax=Cardiocondyla obscurior TaxID=286306 RepID=A0AAW2FDW0_9HYME